MSKINSIKIIIPGLILLMSIVFFSYFSYIKEGKTQSNIVDLKGWAWIGADLIEYLFQSASPTRPVGWISLSSDNPEITCKNVPYKVQINKSSGEIYGKAWIGVGQDINNFECNNTEKTVGFLDFDSVEIPPCGSEGYPSNYCFPAKIVGNEVRGWVPIVSKNFYNATTVVTWVRFKGNNYGVTVSSSPSYLELTGFAWSGLATEGGLGWIKFMAKGEIPTTTATETTTTLPEVPITATFTTPTLPTGEFDLGISDFHIRTFLCDNGNLDLSYLNSYLSSHSNYQFAPSTTYATSTYNEVGRDTCPESQRNRPVTIEVKGDCLLGNCTSTSSKLVLKIETNDPNLPATEKFSTTTETSYNSTYPKSIKIKDYVFDKPYDYKVVACLVDQNGNQIDDKDPSNNCKGEVLRIFDYMCVLGFCAQTQRDTLDPSPILSELKYRILRTFSTHEYPCLYYRNESCKYKYGF
jgi:hypothetical protein